MGGIIPIVLSLGAMGLQQSAQSRQVQYQNQQAEAQRTMLHQHQEQQARQQRGLLERQQASARAAMGGRGLGIGSGSGTAVLAGMTRQAEQAIADNASLAGLRDGMISNDINNRSAQSAGSNVLFVLNLAQTGVNLLR